MQGDWNHVEILSKISHWTSKFGKFAPKIARMGCMWNAFVLLRIPLSSKTTLKMLMTPKTLCSHLYYLLSPLLMVH